MQHFVLVRRMSLLRNQALLYRKPIAELQDIGKILGLVSFDGQHITGSTPSSPPVRASIRTPRPQPHLSFDSSIPWRSPPSKDVSPTNRTPRALVPSDFMGRPDSIQPLDSKERGGESSLAALNPTHDSQSLPIETKVGGSSTTAHTGDRQYGPNSI